ncbi:hypothetical protein PHYPSEUDO_002089 [Phytophthora pseudosyringae]|uniref:M96 mating-specific protein family n=1 Tax=Phytophthora pseudosyringae TaxID=221518 RepID=A0A8T1VYE0_9STRA|nr:hypothetical protein PHYPSEUDO_002089 [Phytophthora pseudosyringae]
MRRDDLAPEAAAVAAFLADISGFLDMEEKVSSPSAVTATHQLIHSVATERPRPDGDGGAERKRALRNLKTGKRRDAYRRRLQEQRQTLRCQEAELAARLEGMQQRRTDNARSAWRAIALRQLGGRRVAEAQQEKLKTAVKRRRELLQDVQSTLCKRLKDAEEAAETREKNALFDRRIRPELSDARLFEAYLDELDVIYAKTDAVFQSSETIPTAGPFLTTKPPMKRDGETEYFENVGVLCVPFESKRSCLAMWEATRQAYRQIDREEYSGLQDGENTIAVRFRVKSRLHTGAMVSLLTHFVSRRYAEASRTVIIWRELWEGEGEFEGMHSEETGWCVIQPADGSENAIVSPTEGLGAAATVIQTCVRLVPMHFNSNVSCKPDFDRFTEVLVTSGKEDNLQVEQLMERMQLGDALAKGLP